MKKILAVVLMIVMAMSLTLAVSAEIGGFIQSPSNNPAPDLIEGSNADPDCFAQIIITAYIDRYDLSYNKRLLLEEAYRIIAENPDLSKLNSTLAAMANALGVKVTDFAVSDLFDISSTYCGMHDEHSHFDVTLKADSLKNFVCLLHYYNGKWDIVEGAEVTHEGTHLEFDIKDFSPFAIVVNTNPKDASDAEADADNAANVDTDAAEEPISSRHGIYMLVADISGFALLGLAIAYKKSKS